jgi:hypothetical protein
VIKMYKGQWSHHGEDEATWGREEELRIDFPIFPSFFLNLEDEIIFKGGRICNTQFVRERIKGEENVISFISYAWVGPICHHM